MKKLFLLILMLSVLAVNLVVFRKRSYLAECPLQPISVEIPDQKNVDWVFNTIIEGEVRQFFVYPCIMNALLKPEIVSLNLADCDDQCFHRERVGFRYLGQPSESVHLFLVSQQKISRDNLLFVEILKGEGATLEGEPQDEKVVFYKNQVLIKKIGLIPLPGYYFREDDISLSGKTLKIRDETYELDLQSPHPSELITGKLPLHFDRPPFINPLFVDDFSSSMRTGGSVQITCDLMHAQEASSYDFLGRGLTNEYGNTCSYSYVGKTKNGVHIVRSCYFDCRPIRCLHFMFVFEKDYEIAVDWKAKKVRRNHKRILIKKVGELDLYCLEYFKIKGNTIYYTNSFWENKPYVITGPVEEKEYVHEVKLKFANTKS